MVATSVTGRAVQGRAGVATALTSLVAVLCVGCMTTAPRLHVDEIAEWHEAHAATLPAFLDTLAAQHVAAARTHIRERLMAKKANMANELQKIALGRIEACGTPIEQEEKGRKVTCLRREIGEVEADGLSRIGDMPRVYRLVRRLSEAEEEYWNSLAQGRARCVTDVQRRLSDALEDFDRKLEDILGIEPEQTSGLQLKWLQCRVEVKWKLSDARWYIDELKKCKSPWHGDCNDPNAAPDLGGSPLVSCLATLANAMGRMEKAINRAEEQLSEHYRDAANEVWGPTPERQSSVTEGCEKRPEDTSDPADRVVKSAFRPDSFTFTAGGR